jgi:hypothetical protein
MLFTCISLIVIDDENKIMCILLCFHPYNLFFICTPCLVYETIVGRNKLQKEGEFVFRVWCIGRLVGHHV